MAMTKNLKTPPSETESFCQSEIDRMLKYSQTKVIMPVIDDISKNVKKYLIDMKVQSISKDDLLKLAVSFDEPEDRQKVLRIVYEEFRREYSSTIK